MDHAYEPGAVCKPVSWWLISRADVRGRGPWAGCGWWPRCHGDSSQTIGWPRGPGIPNSLSGDCRHRAPSWVGVLAATPDPVPCLPGAAFSPLSILPPRACAQLPFLSALCGPVAPPLLWSLLIRSPRPAPGPPSPRWAASPLGSIAHQASRWPVTAATIQTPATPRK